MKGKFDLEDFLDQMQRMKKMGPLGELVKMIPGMGAKMQIGEEEEQELGRVEAIIQSMTTRERHHPEGDRYEPQAPDSGGIGHDHGRRQRAAEAI